MPFDRLLSQKSIQKHQTSKEEINNLFILAERDINDAAVKSISDDLKFTSAYNAVLQCGTIIMHCLGYRTSNKAHHYSTFEFLKEVLGAKFHETINYFNACRSKRNRTVYDMAGQITETEVNTLIKEAMDFYKFTKNWVAKNYPQYL
jgi:uncharacterized protein (UPF0332 family)